MRMSPSPRCRHLLFIILSALSWEGVASAGLEAKSKHEEEYTYPSNSKYKHEAKMPLIRGRGLQGGESVFSSILNFLTFPVCESVGGVPTNDRVFFFRFIFYLIFRRDRLGECPASMPSPSPSVSVTPSPSVSVSPSSAPSVAPPTWTFAALGVACEDACTSLGSPALAQLWEVVLLTLLNFRLSCLISLEHLRIPVLI